MSQRKWFITGVSSGFGRQLTDQLLGRGDSVVGTVRDTGKVTDLLARYPEAFHAEVLDVTDTTAVRDAGYGLFGDPARMAARIIESVDVKPAPLRIVLGSQALEGTLTTLRKRIADFEAQTDLAASTDFPPGE
jgi:NAD(P)-dependent dehydrogenase (short-subunit alcohol dehydrogenase family)